MLPRARRSAGIGVVGLNLPRLAVLGCTVLLFAGCASSPAGRPGGVAGPGADHRARTAQPLPEPARFSAGNIPDVLVRALEDTYRKPARLDCTTLGAEIAALDAVLGADVDTLRMAARRGRAVEQAVAGAVTGLIPYHGVLRLLSGARQREQRIAEAVAAGDIRRGYLKGLGEAAGCAVPAAPLRGDTMQAGPHGKRAG